MSKSSEEKLKKALEENLERETEKVPTERELQEVHEFSSGFLLEMRRLVNKERRNKDVRNGKMSKKEIDKEYKAMKKENKRLWKNRNKWLYAVCGAAVCFIVLAVGGSIWSSNMRGSNNTLTEENSGILSDNIYEMEERDKTDMDIESSYGISGESEENTENGITESNVEIKQNQSTQKLIRTVELSAETEQFDSLVNILNEKIAVLNGYIENSELYGSDNDKLANTRKVTMTIRIPAEQLQNFMTIFQENANVVWSSETTKDVTLDYVDTESHIKSLETEQKALMKLMENAEDLEYILRLQDKLTEVRYKLESYESKLKTYDNQITYSTIQLKVSEVERETTKKPLSFIEEVKMKLGDNLYDIGKNGRYITIWFISSIPYIVIWAIVVVIVVIVVKRILRKRK